PLQPYRDTRRKYAILGGFGGTCLGFMSVLALALADRRVRNVADVRLRLNTHNVLGVLPTLPEDLNDPAQAAVAAHAVHQLRSLLQLRVGVPNPVLAVTS